MDATSHGGNKFWPLALDNATGMTWSAFMKRKKDLQDRMRTFLCKMPKRGSQVRRTRLDNAGENVKLRDMCKDDPELAGNEFEFTPRDSPQHNGRAECKIAVTTARARLTLNAAGFGKKSKMRKKLCAETVTACTDKENILLSRVLKEPAHEAFFSGELANAESLKQFGEMAATKHAPSIEGKLTNGGVAVLHLGRAPDHAADTHGFLHMSTLKLVVSKDAIWLNKVHGEFRGTKDIPPDLVTVTPATTKTTKETKRKTESVTKEGNNTHAPPTKKTAVFSPVATRSRSKKNKENAESSSASPMEKLANADTRGDGTIVDRVDELVESNLGTEEAPQAIDACTMADRFGENFERVFEDAGFTAVDQLPELASGAHEVTETECDLMDPNPFKDPFENRKPFNKAWNHSCPIQRRKWREAVAKEFSKMKARGV